MKGRATYDPQTEIRRLQAEVSELRRKLLGLRHSRRVLMDLIAIREQGYQMMVQQIEMERKRHRRRP